MAPAAPVQGVYVDVLVVTNFLINYALLALSTRLSGRSRKRPRLLLASLIGALFSLSIFLPAGSLWQQLSLKSLASGVMVVLANRFLSFGQLLKEWLSLFLLACCFGGLMSAVCTALLPSFLLYSNGAVYFHLSPLLLVVNITAAYLIVTLASRLFQSSVVGEGYYQVTLELMGRQKRFHALMDTGNQLVEPFSGLPVVVCGLASLEPLLSRELFTALEQCCRPGQPIPCPDACAAQIRMIPFRGVGSAGLLPALRGERLTVAGQGGGWVAENFYVAVSSAPVGGGAYQMLLGRSLSSALAPRKTTVS